MPEKLPTSSITGLEIFATGTWNNDKYSESDLDEMVANFSRVGFQPQIKAGHHDGQEDSKSRKRLFGEPSLGTVSRIYRKGSKLLADIVNIPRRFAQLIQAGSYKRVSSEIYWNYKLPDGKVLSKVLKGVSFLGADIPALTSLKAIESLFSAKGVHVVTYGLNLQNVKEYPMEQTDFPTLLCQYNVGDPEAGLEIDRIVKANLNEGESYSQCLTRLSHEAKVRAYAQADIPIGRKPDTKETLERRYQSGVELDRRAKEIALVQGVGYSQALRIAMLESPDAARNYGYEVDRSYASKMPGSALSNICSPFTMDNGMMDWAEALDAAREHPDVVEKAAAARLEELAMKMIKVEGLAGPISDHLPECRRRVSDQYPSLARAAVNGSAIDEAGLREILWMKK